MGSRTLVLPALAVAAAESYRRWWRPWQLRWGASDEEVARSMPGDEVVVAPSFNATRAISIGARPEDIYPWLVQMGVSRAGWYSYDLLDNLGRPSAEVIHPEYQSIQIGDVVPMSPDGTQGMRVLGFEKDRWLLWWDNKGDSTWVWDIHAAGGRVLPAREPGSDEVSLALTQHSVQPPGGVLRLRHDEACDGGHQAEG